MSEPPLLISVDRLAVHKLYNAALRGEEGAAAELAALWDEYSDREIECFICGAIVEWPVFSMPVPDRRDPSRAILLPLCVGCEGLPTQHRWARVFKILKRMWPGTHFTFSPTR